MLIAIPKDEIDLIPEHRLNVLEYTNSMIEKILRGKINCMDCKFCEVWKGDGKNIEKRNFYRRAYCKLQRMSEDEVPIINRTTVGSDIILFWKEIQEVNFWIPNIIRVKELDMCPVDRALRGEQFLDGVRREEVLNTWKGTRKEQIHVYV